MNKEANLSLGLAKLSIVMSTLHVQAVSVFCKPHRVQVLLRLLCLQRYRNELSLKSIFPAFCGDARC